MAGIFAHVEDDITKLRNLKAEINDVKKSLLGINVKVDIDIKAGLEAQLKSLTLEYDALAQKVAETEAKIANSIANINKATEKIVNAQNEVINNAVGGDPVISSPASSSAETSNIQAQAKAYSELEAEITKILGTREQNISKITEEQHTIDILKKQIKALNDDWVKSGQISDSDRALLDKYNAELLEHKTTLSGVQQVMKNEEKLNQATKGSMQRLAQELARMRIAYRALTDDQKESPFGQELQASIEQADAKIKGLDASIGNYQRNVGNYASKWNGLNFSIQQLAREMPALAYGPQVFFSAISNNLPIFADELKRAKEEYNAFKAAGQSATPVWKQILTSLVSWQTALTVGITLLTVYGKEITNWVASLFKADNALKEMEEGMKKRAKELEKDFTNSFGSSAGKMRANYEELKRKWNEIDNEADKLKFIKKHADDINKFGYEVNNIIQAEDLFNKKTDKVVASFEARARAAASSDIMIKVWQDYYRQLDKIESNRNKRVLEAKQKVGRSTTYFQPMTEHGVGIAKPENSIENDLKRFAEAEDKVNKAIESEIDLIKKERDKQIKKYKKEQEEANKELKKAGAKEEPTTSKELKAEAERAKKEQEQDVKRQQQIRKNALDIRQLEIDMMKEGEEKKLKQIALNYDKEENAIKEYEEKLKQQKIKNAEELFKANPDNKDKSFDASSVDTSLTADEDELINKKRDANLINYFRERGEIWKEGYDKETQARTEYIQKFGTYIQQEQLLLQQHNERLRQLKEQGAGQNAINLENANYEKDLNDLKEKFGKIPTSMADLFGDSSDKSINEIQKIIDKYTQLTELMSKGEATPEALKALGFSEAEIQKIQSGEVNLRDVQQAVKDLKGEVADRSPYKQFTQNITKAINDIKKATNTNDVGKGIAKIGESVQAFIPSLQEFSSNIANIFGFDDSEVQDILGMVNGLGGMASGVGSIMSGDIVGGIMGVASGLSSVVSSFKALADKDNEKRIQTLQKRIDRLDKELNKLQKETDKSYSYNKAKDLEAENENLEKQNRLIEQQIKEEQDKKDTDKDRIKEWEEQIEANKEMIEENKEAMIDAIFGEDVASAISRFAEAYSSVLDGSKTKWESAKEFARQTLRNMALEAIKSSLETSEAIKKMRESMKNMLADGILTTKEKERAEQMAQEVMQDLENQYGWLSDLFQEETDLSATRGSLSSLTQEQGDKLDGRFTALQIAGEMIRNEAVKQSLSLEEQTKNLSIMKLDVATMKNISMDLRDITGGIYDEMAKSYIELQEISSNTLASAKALAEIKTDIKKVKENTERL